MFLGITTIQQSSSKARPKPQSPSPGPFVCLESRSRASGLATKYLQDAGAIFSSYDGHYVGGHAGGSPNPSILLAFRESFEVDRPQKTITADSTIQPLM